MEGGGGGVWVIVQDIVASCSLRCRLFTCGGEIREGKENKRWEVTFA